MVNPISDGPTESSNPINVSDSKQQQSQFTKSHSIQLLPNNWINSPTALKIRKFGYKLMSYITKPLSFSTSEYYEFRMERINDKLNNIHNSSLLKSIFGDRWEQGGAMNIVR